MFDVAWLAESASTAEALVRVLSATAATGKQAQTNKQKRMRHGRRGTPECLFRAAVVVVTGGCRVLLK
jgi:hypothetical protein